MYGDDLIRQKRGDAFLYYQYDGQLSVRQLTDGTGNVTDTYTYDAFGDVLSQSGSTENSYLYTGEQFDPNAGFYYLRARYYDPAAGRFLSSDPWKGNIYEPVTLHKYLYANANPVIHTDPSGEMTLANQMTAVAITGILATGAYHSQTQTGQIVIGAVSGLVINSLNNAIVLLEILDIALMSSKHDQNIVNGLLDHASIHADKIAGYSSSGGPKDPRNHWKKEVKAALDRAKKIVQKRLKGKTREKFLQKIAEIADKAGV